MAFVLVYEWGLVKYFLNLGNSPITFDVIGLLAINYDPNTRRVDWSLL